MAEVETGSTLKSGVSHLLSVVISVWVYWQRIGCW